MRGKGKHLGRLLSIVLVLVSIIGLVPVEAATVKISKAKAVMEVDSTLVLKVSGTDSKVKWSSSNKKIAKVSSNGKVTALKEGTTTIKATVGKTSYTCTISVVDSNKTSNSSDGTLSMNSSDKQAALSVEWLSDRSVFYDDSHKQFRLFFSFKDSSETRIAAPAVVDIRIVNDNNETVYNKSVVVKTSDFGTWTSALYGERKLCCIYINESDIESGTTNRGTLYFSIYNKDYFSFEESELSMNNLPMKESIVSMPHCPQTLGYYSYSGTLYSSCKVTNVTYKIEDDDLYIYFTGEKTYDCQGENNGDRFPISWRLIDSEGYIVDSGTYYSDSLKVGEKFKNGVSYSWNSITPGENYTLEILNTGY